MSGGGGLGNILGAVAPLALGALFPGVGSAIGAGLEGLGASSGVASILGPAIFGAGTGALSSALTHGNPLTGALLGGVGGGIGSAIGGPEGLFGGSSASPLAGAAGESAGSAAAPLSQIGADGSIPNGFLTNAGNLDYNSMLSGGGTSAASGSPNIAQQFLQGGANTASEAPSGWSSLLDYAKKNPLQAAQLGGIGLSSIDALVNPPKQVSAADAFNQVKALHPGFYADLPQYHVEQTSTPYTGDWYKYGETPEEAMLKRQTKPGAAPMATGGMAGYAHGDRPQQHVNPLTGSAPHKGIVPGMGKGQADDVPAMLSSNEFVIPADVVAHLGDGSSDAGGHELDKMVKKVRKHKATKGFPPLAKNPLQYIGA